MSKESSLEYFVRYEEIDKAIQNVEDAYKPKIAALEAENERLRDKDRCYAEFIEAVHKESDAPEWEYPGQVIRDVRRLREQRDNIRADLARVTAERDLWKQRADWLAMAAIVENYLLVDSDCWDCDQHPFTVNRYDGRGEVLYDNGDIWANVDAAVREDADAARD